MSRGFTITEVLVVVAILAALMSVIPALTTTFSQHNDLSLAVSSYTAALARAQALAQAVQQDVQWGVRVGSSTITVFKGPSYASRDPGADETTTFGGSVSPSGLLEVVFSKVGGTTTQTGTTIFASGGVTRSVSLNAQGTATY